MICSLLEQLHNLKRERPVLFRKSRYTIKEKAANEKARFQRLMDFEGPDSSTLQMLHDFGDSWQRNPMTFWEHASIMQPSATDLQARMVMLYRRTIHMDS